MISICVQLQNSCARFWAHASKPLSFSLLRKTATRISFNFSEFPNEILNSPTLFFAAIFVRKVSSSLFFYFTPFSPNTTLYYLRECILKIYLKIITRQCFTTTDFFFFITTACPKKTDCFIYDQIMAKIFSVFLFFDILLLQLSIDTGISLRKIYCVFPFRLLFTLSENVTRLPVPVFNAVK